MQCPKCGTDVPADYNFCEIDGTPLRETVTSPLKGKPSAFCRCGAVISSPDEDGFCAVCGELWEARYHIEYDYGATFAAITDRGLQHTRNEDAVGISVEQARLGDHQILIVCDGLSSAQRSSEASNLAAQTALSQLATAVHDGVPDLLLCMKSAILAAHKAVCLLEFDDVGQKEPPGTTIVAALVTGNTAVVGWVGDSRAYLQTGSETKLLTKDDSWVNQVVDSGQLAEIEAINSANAHMITHCIGPVEMVASGAEPIPSIVACELAPSSRLILCSDGLWNYAEKLDDFNSLLQSALSQNTALAFAKYLVAFAISKGGRDNITVAILESGPAEAINAI